MRVLHNGPLLAGMDNANIRVVELFCMLHDTQRRNERRDPSHGRRAARYAKSLRGVWFDLSDKEMELLTEALKYHSDGYTEADITVQVCWDADRLDPRAVWASSLHLTGSIRRLRSRWMYWRRLMRGRWRVTSRLRIC